MDLNPEGLWNRETHQLIQFRSTMFLVYNKSKRIGSGDSYGYGQLVLQGVFFRTWIEFTLYLELSYPSSILFFLFFVIKNMEFGLKSPPKLCKWIV